MPCALRPAAAHTRARSSGRPPSPSQLDGPQLSEEEQREQLLGKVKADNAQIADCERRLSEAQEAIRAGKKQLAKLANDVNEANDPKGTHPPSPSLEPTMAAAASSPHGHGASPP